jgi:hypothetical protein
MSALPPKADIRHGDPNVCFGPKADIGALLDAGPKPPFEYDRGGNNENIDLEIEPVYLPPAYLPLNR